MLADLNPGDTFITDYKDLCSDSVYMVISPYELQVSMGINFLDSTTKAYIVNLTKGGFAAVPKRHVPVMPVKPYNVDPYTGVLVFIPTREQGEESVRSTDS